MTYMITTMPLVFQIIITLGALSTLIWNYVNIKEKLKKKKE